MPCSVNILISSLGLCPIAFAFLVAICCDIATSPASPSAKSAIGGNDSTSVGLSLPRKRRFKERISWLLVTTTFTLPFNLAALHALVTKRANADSFNCLTGLRRITNLFAPCIDAKTKIGGHLYALPQYFTALLANCCFVVRFIRRQRNIGFGATRTIPSVQQ